MKKTMKKTLGPVIGAALALALPFILRNGFDWNYGVQLACFFLLYAIAVSGLDILFGYAGQISLGHAAFFAIGAYGSVMLHQYANIPVFFSMIIAAAFATVVGAALAYPASKLVFHFLSLATIAFGEVVYQFVSQSPGSITGNFTGMFTQTVSLFGYKLNSFTKYYYFALAAAVILLVIKRNMIKSRVGRALIAIRENSHAAEGMGVNVRKYKIIAFAVSAFYTAYAGALYAHLVRYISPDTFAYKQSVMFMTMLLFGGTASIAGPMSGVLAVQALNECLRSAETYQMLIYGILLLTVIVVMPGGISGVVRDVAARIRYRKSGAAAAGDKKEEVDDHADN